MTAARRIPNPAGGLIRVTGGNRATHYARYWLELLGETVTDDPSAPIVIIGEDDVDAPCVIRLWDNQVGMSGDGVFASALSGAATVIGRADGPAIPLPADMPEKWCGAHGVILALAEAWRLRRGATCPVRYDVSAADILRAFSLQNSGGPKEMQHLWRRNGRLCIDHGGIFPMGFFACQDGHVAILGRSKRDWRQIRIAIGDPEWAKAERFQNPFLVARDSEDADRMLEETLAQFTRDELLARGLEHGAVIAPVYSQTEAAARDVFREGFIVDGAGPAMPFRGTETPGPTKPAAPQSRPIPDMPLAGMRVLEFAWVWSGPMVGQMLVDLGAEVIKVEAPGRFDLYRTRGLEAERGKMDEKARIESSLYFHSLNRNKIGLALDLKTETDLDLAKQVAAKSDILLENFTVGTMDRLGLGAETLVALNPSLVQLSLSGPGRGSALEKLRSYGLVLSALGGAEHLIRDGNEFLGSPTFSVSDPNAAVFAAMASLAAALHADTTGAGHAIDVSQIEAAATLAGAPVVGEAVSQIVERAGTSIAVSSDGDLETPVLQLEDTDDAPAFATCDGWLPAAHPSTGDETLVAAPWRVNGARPRLRKAAPILGEGDDYVLRHVLGLDEASIADIQAKRAI
jgi:crotonobetainyl-CoA:carnitine CoA-transferase CaiB-like acyl-CoA transferase